MACQAVALIIISFVRSRFPDEVFLSVITVIVSDPVGPIRRQTDNTLLSSNIF